PVEFIAAGEIRMRQNRAGDACLVRALEAIRIGAVADHLHQVGIQVTAGLSIDQGLQVAARTRDQHGDPAGTHRLRYSTRASLRSTTLPISQQGIPASCDARIRFGAALSAAIMTMPMPQLKVRSISASLMPP